MRASLLRQTPLGSKTDCPRSTARLASERGQSEQVKLLVKSTENCVLAGRSGVAMLSRMSAYILS